MRIVLFGGTDLTFAVAEHLGDHVAGVVTIEGTYKISFSPTPMSNVRFADMASWSAQRGVPCVTWSDAAAAEQFARSLGADWGLAVGWYYLLPPSLLAAFPFGLAGVHASLLPKYRGNSPLNWAILNGESQSGVSLFRMTPGLDDGPLYGQRTFPIGSRTTIAELINVTQEATLGLLSAAVAAMDRDESVLVEQEGTPSFALARTPDDGAIDWGRSAEYIDRLVRATSQPYPGAFTHLEGAKITIWSGEPLREPATSGTCGQLWRWNDRVVVVSGSGLFAVDTASLADGTDAIPLLRKSSQRRLA
jgi:methionyl-tRNA formyltransferase